jgi:hypothetical protein
MDKVTREFGAVKITAHRKTVKDGMRFRRALVQLASLVNDEWDIEVYRLLDLIVQTDELSANGSTLPSLDSPPDVLLQAIYSFAETAPDEICGQGGLWEQVVKEANVPLNDKRLVPAEKVEGDENTPNS